MVQSKKIELPHLPADHVRNQIAKTICFHTHAVPAAYSLLLALVPEEPCMSTVADIISWVAWLEMIDPCVCERAWETLCHC